MKRISILLISIFCFTSLTYSQGNVAKAKEILGKLSSKYKGYKSLKADFKYVMEMQAEKIKEEQKGTLYIKNDKFRLEMNDQTVISDGKNMWTYLKEANEVQVNKYDPKVMDINPTEIFTMYEKGFLYQFTGEEKDGNKVVQVIELTPNDKKKSYFKVKLFVDKNLSQISKTKIFEKNGNIYTYEILNLSPNPSLSDSQFTFDKTKYPKVSVVDLR